MFTHQHPHCYILAIVSTLLFSPASAQAPVIYDRSTEYHYDGCYPETIHLSSNNGTRALNSGASQAHIGNMTVDKCLDLCGGGPGATYTYAGLENSRECWCAQTLDVVSLKINDSACGLSCDGNASQICGGPMILSMYTLNLNSNSASVRPWTALAWMIATMVSHQHLETSVLAFSTFLSLFGSASAQAPSLHRRSTQSNYLGCYDLGAHEIREVLSGMIGTMDGGEMTAERCLDVCSGMPGFDFKYAGLTKTQCACVLHRPRHSDGLSRTEDENCDIACAGDASTTCGGDRYLTLYALKRKPASKAPRVPNKPRPRMSMNKLTRSIHWARWAAYWTLTLRMATLVTQLSSGVRLVPTRRIITGMGWATVFSVVSTRYLDQVWWLGPGNLQELRYVAKVGFLFCIVTSAMRLSPPLGEVLNLSIPEVRWTRWGTICSTLFFVATVLLTCHLDGGWWPGFA